MLGRPFFSVIITTYNREGLIGRALKSLLSQSFPEWECIISDDGSMDDTYQVVKPYLLERKKFKYTWHFNSGPGIAKNRGIREARGKYVTFLDSDDEYLPEHLEKRMEYLLENPETDLLHSPARVIGDKMVADYLDPDKMISVSDCAIGGTFVINRTKLLQNGGYSRLPYGDDADFLKKAMSDDWNINYLPLETYIYHRDHKDTLCNGRKLTQAANLYGK